VEKKISGKLLSIFLDTLHHRDCILPEYSLKPNIFTTYSQSGLVGGEGAKKKEGGRDGERERGYDEEGQGCWCRHFYGEYFSTIPERKSHRKQAVKSVEIFSAISWEMHAS